MYRLRRRAAVRPHLAPPSSPRGRARRTFIAGLSVIGLATMGVFAAALPAQAAETPEISVYLADGTPYTDQVVTDGDTLIVKGAGFDPAGNLGTADRPPIPADLPQGDYVLFGNFAPTWQPSAGVKGDTRHSDSGSQVWVLAESVLEEVPEQFQGAIRARWVPLADDGTFSATIAVTAPDEIAADGVWGIYSYPAGSAVNPAHELSVPVNYVSAADAAAAEEEAAAEEAAKEAAAKEAAAKKKAEEEAAAKEAATTKPTVTCTTETIPANIGTPRLSWGVKGSFLGYVDSSLADGIVAAGNGANWNGSTVTWGTGSGALNSDGIGTLSFPGTLKISGHEGVLDLTISNLKLQTTGSKAGTLSATIASSDMDGNPVSASGELAKLSFSSLSQTGGTASATLSANGAKAFAGFYSAGEALDSLTVSFAGSSPERTVERCVDADGNPVNADGTPLSGLAATGVNTTHMLLLAASLLGWGALLVRVGRQRGFTAA